MRMTLQGGTHNNMPVNTPNKTQSKTLHVRNQLHHHDKDFLDKLIPYFHLIEKYFQYEAVGLENIPEGKKSIVVMNHGIIPYHGFLLCKKLIEVRKIYARGLGAGFLFDIPFVREFFLKSGAVNANPANARALLRNNSCVFLAPGGIYEGLICHPGMKRIPWERRFGFVEVALDTGTPIVPTYCEGIHHTYINSQFLLKLRIKILEATRFSVPLFFGLGLLPFPVKMVHFVGKPIPAKRKKGESREEALKRIHAEVVAAMKKLAS